MRPFASLDEGSVNHIVRSSAFNVRRRAPFDCQEQVGGWESFFHCVNKAIRIFGFGEFFLERQQVCFRKIYRSSRVKGSATIAMSRDNNWVVS
jgi:hypothetical protein